jgi:hypothetical protein
MFNVISDPNLYVLFFAAYVVGFIDLDEPSNPHRGWARVSELAFWCGLALAAALFATHGLRGGAVSLLAAWAISVIGLRRGVLAQRNSLWETALWTTPLERITAATAAAPEPASVAAVSPATAPGAANRDRAFPPRGAAAPARADARQAAWQLPTLAHLLPGRGRRLTILGIAIDVASCLVVVSALSLLAR